MNRGAFRGATAATLPDELELLAANYTVSSGNCALGDALFLLLEAFSVIFSQRPFSLRNSYAIGAILLQSTVHDIGLAAFYTDIRAPELARFPLSFALFTFSLCRALRNLAAGSAVKGSRCSRFIRLPAHDAGFLTPYYGADFAAIGASGIHRLPLEYCAASFAFTLHFSTSPVREREAAAYSRGTDLPRQASFERCGTELRSAQQSQRA